MISYTTVINARDFRAKISDINTWTMDRYQRKYNEVSHTYIFDKSNKKSF